MRKVIITLFFTLLGAGLAITESLWEWGQDDFILGRNLTIEDLEFSFIVTDRNDQEIYRSFDKENREWTPFKEIPQTLRTATIIAEDKRFYSHFGVDVKGIVRAAWKNHQAGYVVQGGSTITQQIARKVFLNDEKSYERKLRELFIAQGIESSYSKDEILTLYLNTVPYGPRINGVAVASRVYFNKPPSELNDAESIALAVLPKNPVQLSRKDSVSEWLGDCPVEFVDNKCSPFIDLNYDFSRVESLLFAVAENHKWDAKKTQSVWKELKEMGLEKKQKWVEDDFQHFRFYIQNFLIENGFDMKQASKGIVVKTTLDADLQKQVYKQLRREADWLDSRHWIENFATVILDHETRGPLVWIGSKNFWNRSIAGQVDMLQSRRQTGSTIKPFIYKAAIEEGYQPPTIFYDSALKFRQNGTVIRNSDGHFLGGIRMTTALAYSRNVPATKALLMAGGENTVKNYLDTKFGFDIREKYKGHAFGWTLALGTAPVELIDLANAYATLGSNEHQEICPIISITSLDGKDLNSPCKIRIKRKVDPVSSYFIADILSNNDARPEEWSELVAPNKPMAIKTGTSSKRVDGVLMPADDLIVGYTPKMTILLWGGNTDGQALKPGSVSILAIGSTWKRLANLTLKKHPGLHENFTPPVPLQKINGEWATLDYQPPSYNNLGRFVNNPERGLNVFGTLEHER